MYMCVCACMYVHISLGHNNSIIFYPFNSKFFTMLLGRNAIIPIKFKVNKIKKNMF